MYFVSRFDFVESVLARQLKQTSLLSLTRRFPLSIRCSSLVVHLLSPLFYEGLHVGGYFALEIHLLARGWVSET